LGERSILWDELDRPGFSFEHWTKLMAACRKEQTLWPNWYKSLTIANVEYDNFGDKLDFIPKYQDLIFNSTAFRNRLRDNYERCKVCIDTTLDRRLTPTQLRRLMHHSERKKDILSGQKLLEYARD
ncbi:unnamed protein product, partial [Chrysoparadoxa australica]